MFNWDRARRGFQHLLIDKSHCVAKGRSGVHYILAMRRGLMEIKGLCIRDGAWGFFGLQQ